MFRALKAGLHLVFMQVSPTPKENVDVVSLLKLKDAVRRLLPAGSIARTVITAEPDALPLAEALAKFKVFDRLLVEELSATRGPR